MKMSERTVLLLAILVAVVVMVVVFIQSRRNNRSAWWSILNFDTLDYDTRKFNHYVYTKKEHNDPT